MKLNELKRPLDIKDIDFRVQSINKGGYAVLLAYKDARVDMNRLDEVCGHGKWQRDHKEINGVIYGGIGILCEEHQDGMSVIHSWVWKWDAGSESFTEKEKGQASDSFKRAGFNWGIGRELYDYPSIKLKLINEEYKVGTDGKARATWTLRLKEWTWFSEFEYGKISYLGAKDENGIVRFQFGKLKAKK